MAFVSDVALIGTGVAPLVAASHLLAEGKSVLLLNPDWDFFREDSELPFDPFWPPSSEAFSLERLSRSLRKRSLSALRPDFPGAIELWSGEAPGAAREGFHDADAPHVRTRTRLWLHANDKDRTFWERLEDLYIETSDAGFNPVILQGASALHSFPGASSKLSHAESLRAFGLPKMSDVDVARYRNGLLEFVRERVGEERVFCAASQIEWMPEGLRFHAGGHACSARIEEGVLVFWTPRLSQWVLSQAKKAEVMPLLPRGLRLWEEWSLLSRESLDPSVLGSFEDMLVWAEVEGAPDVARSPLHRLAVLRAGPLLPYNNNSGSTLASAESFGSVARLCHDLLKWDKFSVRSLRPRALFEWPASRQEGFWLANEPVRVRVVSGCDGPLVDVVNSARRACSSLEGHEEES
jgi:hypothetical protein